MPLSEAEVRAHLNVPWGCGFAFHQWNHDDVLRFPRGPVWAASRAVLSDTSTDAVDDIKTAVTVRFRVTGNSSFDFGLVPHNEAGSDYLYMRGQYGFNSASTGGGVLPRLHCFEKPVEVHVDINAGLLQVRVFSDESWHSVAEEHTQQVPAEGAWRLALGGFEDTSYVITSWQEAPGGKKDTVDWFTGRRALARILPVDALTGYHGIFVHGRDMSASRAANCRLAAAALANMLVSHSSHDRGSTAKLAPGSRAILAEITAGLAEVTAAATAAAATEASARAASAAVQSDPESVAPEAIADASHSSMMKMGKEAKDDADAQVSLAAVQMRMLCSMFFALSMSRTSGDAVQDGQEDGMLDDIMLVLQELMQGLRAAAGHDSGLPAGWSKVAACYCI